MARGGATTWYFPDGYLPERNGHGGMEAHEALMLLNVGTETADVKIDVYFEDKEPFRDIAVAVAPERIRTLRLDMPSHMGGLAIPPLTQYSLRIRSSQPIVAQFGRLDTTQNNMAYYVGVGFCEDA